MGHRVVTLLGDGGAVGVLIDIGQVHQRCLLTTGEVQHSLQRCATSPVHHLSLPRNPRRSDHTPDARVGRIQRCAAGPTEART